MRAEQLRHRVTLQSQVTTQDALGQPSTTWIDTATVWADVRHQSGVSTIKSGADVSVVRASIRIRHRPVSPGQRVLFESQVYAISAVLPDGRKTAIDLVCEAINVQS